MATGLTPGAGPYRRLSLWWDGLEGPVTYRSSLPGDLDVDVAVVGGGYTGLWTARSLALAQPDLRIAVFEREVAGFGASGRNGGWCSALFAASDERLRREHGAPAATALRRVMEDTVDEVGRAAEAEGIDCRFAKGGTVVAARNPAQVIRGRQRVEAARAHGAAEDDLRWLEADEAQQVMGAEGVLGATYTPHCAAIDPARLVRGLADAVERRGVALYERTTALAVEPGGPGRRPVVRTDHGSVRADVVVRALEGFTPDLPGEQRTLVPIYSLMLATEPLPESFWAEAGLARRETFADYRHLIIYGQRTADGRLAFGGRGAPYHYGSDIGRRHDLSTRIHRDVHRALVELFPALAEAEITHRWGGPIGVPRDWYPSVGLDRPTGLAWGGGYVGDGVATSNLAGRTLADLILGRDSELVALPWVGHRWPRWEPEPLRWLGVNAALHAMALADRSETRRGRPSAMAGRMERLLGG
ncbi:MAG TPA: FAD-binding oxidoreductase [Acidimicrobiales bacterium]|nr:FAD-binding oxidoreductase [Acidimicrobiales bacterium]